MTDSQSGFVVVYTPYISTYPYYTVSWSSNSYAQLLYQNSGSNFGAAVAFSSDNSLAVGATAYGRRFLKCVLNQIKLYHLCYMSTLL